MVFKQVSQLISPFERIHNLVVPTDNSNQVPKVPNLEGPFLAHIFQRVKNRCQGFSKTTIQVDSQSHKKQKTLKSHGLKINWNRDINGQYLTNSGGKKSKFVNFPFLSIIFYIYKSMFYFIYVGKRHGENKNFLFIQRK